MHNVYVPELIFGHLLTSDNYDDSDARVTGGRNGFGAKLTNVFSKKFKVDVIDSFTKKQFKMVWENNMSKHTPPDISAASSKTNQVKVTFWPDLAKFRVPCFESGLLSLLKKRVRDVAGTVGVRVTLNGVRINVGNFKEYVNLYFLKPKHLRSDPNSDGASPPDLSVEGSSEVLSDRDDVRRKKVKVKSEELVGQMVEGLVKIHEKVNARWEIVVSQSDGQFQQVSFVNSICTSRGGTHVQHVIDPIVQAVLKKVQVKNKGGIEIKAHNVRNHIWLFVNCLIVNPTFDSQTKETLTLRPSSFGSTCTVSDKTIQAVVKSPITESVLLWAQTKQQVDLKRIMKSGPSSRARILGVPKLEDANDAGGKFSHLCTLILTEGDSAKTSCVAGLSVVGRDRFGVFPLRGKVLNVRDASFKALTENKEIQNILTITGLDVGKKIQDPKSLRYGSIMIMTDQDHDGSHIKGLLINLLQHYWPDLLKRPGFLKEFVTPIVKVSRGSSKLPFFTIPEYEAWKKANRNGKGWKIKYYKGLGTSDDREFKEYFSNLNEHSLQFKYSGPEDFEAIDMAFNAKRAEDRKNWIQSFEEGTYLDHRDKTVSFSDFVNKELVLFSKYDTERSIPSVMDGWKPGQRKVLFGVFKRGLTTAEMKVAQLASYVADVSCYHHGEESLASTIVGMAQNFVGSNNVNVLEPCGQFGSRKEGGKDASATRYIYTKLSVVARALFVAEDEDLLHYHNEEGRVIEPRWFVPVIPTVLVNGSEGIGTGWSSSVPNYDPLVIIANLRAFIAGEPMTPMIPNYRGFRGRIEPNSKSKGFDSVGIIEKLNETTLHISELPVKMWTQPYKEFLEDLMLTGVEAEQAAASRGNRAKTVAKGKAKAGARRGGGGERAAPKPSLITIQDFRDNCTHDSISFTVRLEPSMMTIAESEGFEKVFKLRKAIGVTNMTLFSPEGHVQRYETELDILREFAKVRLDFYHRRRRHMINVMEKELCLISNKMRFILEVVEGQLVIAKRTKANIYEDLKLHGFETLEQIEAKFDTKNPTREGEVPDDGVVVEKRVDEDDGDDMNYNYLLSISLWGLTFEKVESLRKQRQSKATMLEDFKRKSAEDLWEEDLRNLESCLHVFYAQFENEHKRTEHLKRVSLTAVKPKPKRRVKPLLTSSEESRATSSADSDAPFVAKAAQRIRKPQNVLRAPQTDIPTQVAGTHSNNKPSVMGTELAKAHQPERGLGSPGAFSVMARLREKMVQRRAVGTSDDASVRVAERVKTLMREEPKIIKPAAKNIPVMLAKRANAEETQPLAKEPKKAKKVEELPEEDEEVAASDEAQSDSESVGGAQEKSESENESESDVSDEDEDEESVVQDSESEYSEKSNDEDASDEDDD